MTATLTRADALETKAFTLTVQTLPETDLEAVTYDKSNLVIGYAAGDSASSVTGNVTLDTEGDHGSAITWSTDNDTVITAAGVVRRLSGTDATVTLTASIAKGTEVLTKTFVLTVKGTPIPVIVAPPPPVSLTDATAALIGSSGDNAIVAPVDTSTNGEGVVVTKVDEQKLLNQLSQGDTLAIVIPLPDTKGTSVVSLTPGLLTALQQKDEHAKVVFQSNGVTYEIPAALADVSAIEQALGLTGTDAEDAELRIAIELVPASTVQRQIADANGTLAASVVSFSISVVTPNRTYELNDFAGTYISRSFELDKAVDPSVAVGVIVHSDGTVTPVPTTFTTVGGTPVAVLKADHNSVYTVIEHTSALTDVDASWAKDNITALANKLIIKGYEDGTFKPNGNVTRAEFAQMIVAGLGLNAVSGSSKFSDVNAEAWYAGVVGAASSRGFITGYEGGSFKPNQPITREEEAVILSRVLAYLRHEANASEAVLAQFRDRDAIAAYARSAVAMLAELKVMNGNAQGDVSPKAAATRAETAALIYKLLRSVDLLN